MSKLSHMIGNEDPQVADADNLAYMLKSLSSTMPALVVAIDYDRCCVSVQPLIKTEITKDRYIPYPVMHEVPLLISSGNAGKARQTMPIKAGIDVVELSFADRDTVNFLCSAGQHQVLPESDLPLSMGGQHYVLVAKPCITLQANARAMDPENVVTENEYSRIIQTPNGTTTITNSKGAQVVISSDGAFSYTNASCNFALTEAGELNFKGGNASINGAQITKAGNVITAAGTDLDALMKSFNAHIHSGVQKGGDNTGGIC